MMFYILRMTHENQTYSNSQWDIGIGCGFKGYSWDGHGPGNTVKEMEVLGHVLVG